MGVYRLYPSRDTFLASDKPDINAGLDEILEVSNVVDALGIPQVRRTVVDFNLNDILDVQNNLIGLSDYTASLKLYLADANSLPVRFRVDTHLLSGSWDMGVGKIDDIRKNQPTGATWTVRKTTQQPWISGSFTVGTTGSYQESNKGGGVWFTVYSGSQELSYSTPLDLKLNVTNLIQDTGSLYVATYLDNEGSYINESEEEFFEDVVEGDPRLKVGFIVKLAKEWEFRNDVNLNLKYYGRDTNTIYSPYLEFIWNDTQYITGSLPLLTEANSIIKITNLKPAYKDEGVARFRLAAAPKYPVRTFTTSSVYLNRKRLPEETYWALQDENTEELVIPFDEIGTRVGCDVIGNYFDMYLNALQPNRYYKIIIKTTLDGVETINDINSRFKVTHNG